MKERTFKPGRMTHLHKLDDRGFGDLAKLFRRRLNGSQFVAHVIDPQTPYRVKFDIFLRFNTGGSPLSAQEIRHCMSRKRSREFLKALASHQSFVAATGGALRNDPRIADRAMALLSLLIKADGAWLEMPCDRSVHPPAAMWCFPVDLRHMPDADPDIPGWGEGRWVDGSRHEGTSDASFDTLSHLA